MSSCCMRVQVWWHCSSVPPHPSSTHEFLFSYLCLALVGSLVYLSLFCLTQFLPWLRGKWWQWETFLPLYVGLATPRGLCRHSLCGFPTCFLPVLYILCEGADPTKSNFLSFLFFATLLLMLRYSLNVSDLIKFHVKGGCRFCWMPWMLLAMCT